MRTLLKDYRTQLAIGRDANSNLLTDNEDLATNWKTHYENWAVNVLHESFTHEIYAESSQIPRVNAQGEKTYEEYIDGYLTALSYREADFAETYEVEENPTPISARIRTIRPNAPASALFSPICISPYSPPSCT